MTCRLPWGRRLACYWRQNWRLRYERFANARMVRLGPMLITLYWNRMDWLDADRAVERLHQQRQQERGA